MSNLIAMILQYKTTTQLRKILTGVMLVYLIMLLFYIEIYYSKSNSIDTRAINKSFANRKIVLDRGCAMIHNLRRVSMITIHL